MKRVITSEKAYYWAPDQRRNPSSNESNLVRRIQRCVFAGSQSQSIKNSVMV